nr:hypothetical protein [Tanacetum cinerariifolium]
MRVGKKMNSCGALFIGGKIRFRVAEGALDIAEGAQAILAPVQAPQPLLVAGPSRSLPQRVARLEVEVHGMRGELGEQREVLDSIACDFSRFTKWAVIGLSRIMDHVGVRNTSYSPAPQHHRSQTPDLPYHHF